MVVFAGGVWTRGTAGMTEGGRPLLEVPVAAATVKWHAQMRSYRAVGQSCLGCVHADNGESAHQPVLCSCEETYAEIDSTVG